LRFSKVHGADKDLADEVVNAQHMTRREFLDLYRAVFGKPFPRALAGTFEKAAKTRDMVVHGKSVLDSEIWQAHVDIIEYAEGVNSELLPIAGFEPFGDLRGYNLKSSKE
jgi:hypothetical protein